MNKENTLWNAMQAENNVTCTENGDKAYKSTLNPLLDFMFKAATMRDSNEAEIKNLFIKAYNYNNVYAIRLAFYVRDIRGGQGERRVFRICMNTLSEIDPITFNKVMSFIPEYGRWDDLIDIMHNIENKECQQTIVDLIASQFNEDLDNFNAGKTISLLAKWLPSENASSAETIIKAKRLRKTLDLSSKEYRKILSLLRNHINIVERQMTSKTWNEINYNNVPSKAMMKYRQAFMRNDKERYSDYLNKLAEPEKNNVKINAATLYPFDIISKLNISSWKKPHLSKEECKLFDAQWKALPDFFEGKFDNALVVADTSGSMTGTPLNVAIGLAMYLAERNKGIFNNKFITFSRAPELQEIIGTDIANKAFNLSKAAWDGNTDIEAVFELILNSALKANASQNELPSMIYIISDMQFDCCNSFEDETVFEKYQREFNEAGYQLPKVVFWNVSDYGNNNVPITVTNTGAIVCSGYSPSVVKYIMESDATNTMQLIENIVRSERYACILA